ncbi:hypothetical protein E4U17_002466 [Claviceps sp. LM77 group G4]|nr:hypothetical protein E4U17_002466 [Claviceps sp. LM77 group G4]
MLSMPRLIRERAVEFLHNSESTKTSTFTVVGEWEKSYDVGGLEGLILCSLPTNNRQQY